MISIDDLITPITEDQFIERFLSNLETLGLKARSWRKAGVYRTIIRVLAIMCATFSSLFVGFVRSGFLELAERLWLTWVAYYVYGVTRPGDTYATGQVTLTNTGGGDYTWAPQQLRLFNTALNKAFTNSVEVVLHPLATLSIDVIAVEVGSASSSAAGAIDGIETQYAAQITVTNAAPVVGSDAMIDTDLRQLCRDKIATRSVFGVRDAYRYYIRSATRTDGSTVDINRMSISPSSSNGTVTMFVASPSGVPTTSDVTACAANADNARPDTVTAVLSAATPVTISRSISIWAEKQPGLIADDLKALALKQLVDLNRSYPIGGIKKDGPLSYFFADRLEGKVQGAHPAIFDVDGVGADVAMTAGQVAILAVTIDTVHIVDTEIH